MAPIFKYILYILLVLTVVIFLTFIKVQPQAIAYTPYNEMYNSYCMYYVNNQSIAIDAQPNRDLAMAKRKPSFEKKCTTVDFKISVPLFMLFDWRKTIGHPGNEAQGGIVLEFELLGITKYFNLDPLETINYYPSLNEEIFKRIQLIEMEMQKEMEEEQGEQPSIQIGS